MQRDVGKIEKQNRFSASQSVTSISRSVLSSTIANYRPVNPGLLLLLLLLTRADEAKKSVHLLYIHTVSGRIGTNGSDVLLPTPLLLLPRHEQLRLISSYCFTRRGKVSFRLASFSFLRAFYPLPRIFFSRQRVYIVCASSCDREHLERCFFQRAFPLIITDNVIRTPPSTRFSNSLIFKFFFSFRCARFVYEEGIYYRNLVLIELLEIEGYILERRILNSIIITGRSLNRVEKNR